MPRLILYYETQIQENITVVEGAGIHFIKRPENPAAHGQTKVDGSKRFSAHFKHEGKKTG